MAVSDLYILEVGECSAIRPPTHKRAGLKSSRPALHSQVEIHASSVNICSTYMQQTQLQVNERALTHSPTCHAVMV